MPVKSREPRETLHELQRAVGEIEQRLQELTASLPEGRTDESGDTVHELAERAHVPEEAVRAFAETAGQLLAGAEMSEAEARRAAMLAVAEAAWEETLGPLLSSSQVRELLGVSRQRVDQLVRRKRLIGLRERLGRRRYPLFQFNEERASEPLVSSFWIVADGTASDWTAASWCVQEDSALGGLSPVEWVRRRKDPERLLQVARQDAARLSR